jgi:hypothetical protein
VTGLTVVWPPAPAPVRRRVTLDEFVAASESWDRDELIRAFAFMTRLLRRSRAGWN